MRAQFDAIPALIINVECRKHHCSVQATVEARRSTRNGPTVGAEVIATECHIGGPIKTADCKGKWKVLVESPASITIVQH